jgi:hypothetical protein
LQLELPIVIHPPEDMSRVEVKCLLRNHEVVKVLSRKPYLARNRDIVNESDRLITLPKGPETLRSGTWATVRYAVEAGKPVRIYYPNAVTSWAGSFGATASRSCHSSSTCNARK